MPDEMIDEQPIAYHLLFVEVEYDPNYSGGDYTGVGTMVLLPVILCDRLGVKKAFKHITGHDPVHIVHYSSDALWDSRGEIYTEWEEEFPESTRARKLRADEDYEDLRRHDALERNG